MHELSIALNIVEIAEQELQRHGGRVEAVHLRLGPLSGVDKDALLFSWGLACEDTSLAGARLQIEETPVTVWCAGCQAERTLAGEIDLRCPACGGASVEIRSGRELEVSALDIEEAL